MWCFEYFLCDPNLIFLWSNRCHPNPHAHIFSLKPEMESNSSFCQDVPQLPGARLYLVGLQFVCVAGEPLDQVLRNHVPRSARERRVGRAGVLQLLPLPDTIHRPVLPETVFGMQTSYPPSFDSTRSDRGGLKKTKHGLTSPTRNGAASELCGQFLVTRSPHRCSNRHPPSAAD